MRGAVLAISSLLAAAFLLAFGMTPISVNVSPLAKATIVRLSNSPTSSPLHERYLNVDAPDLPMSGPDALTDSLYEPTHLFQFPLQNSPWVVLHFPFFVSLDRFQVLGAADQESCELSISATLDGHTVPIEQRPWQARGGVPPLLNVTRSPLLVDSVSVSAESSPPDQPMLLTLNSINCRMAMTRWQGLAGFFLLTVLGPWVTGMIHLYAILGAGKLIARNLGVQELAAQFVLGVIAMTLFAVAWWSIPRSWISDGIWIAVVILLAVLQKFAFRNSSIAFDETNDREPMGLMPFASILLLIVLVADTYGIGTHRVQPLDFLQAYFGGERLSRAMPMPQVLADRPWLVHMLFAPLDHVAERFGYFAYLGFMSCLNATILIAAAKWFGRWLGRSSQKALTFFALMPAIGCFHFLGQRPFSAGLALLAFHWLTETSQPKNGLLAGLAMLLAIGAHPSAAFFLCIVILWMIVRGRKVIALSQSILFVALPIVGYGIWILAMAHQYPARENALMYYPFSLDWNPPGSKGMNFLERIESIPAETWRTLAQNRIGQLRHYFFTDNQGGGTAAIFRWISLPNVLGYVACLGLLRRSFWRRDREFLLVTVLGTLLFHHAYIGQANPQFHISPIPFLALSMLVAAEFSSTPKSRLGKLLSVLVVCEWGFRQALPLWVAFRHSMESTGPLESLRIFGTDQTSYLLVASAPLFVWILGAIWQLRTRE